MRMNCAWVVAGEQAKGPRKIQVETVADIGHDVATTMGTQYGQNAPSMLAIYLTPTSSYVHQKLTWLPLAKLTLVDAALVETHGVRLDDPTLLLQSLPLLGSDFEWCDQDIHIVAVLTRDGPPLKRARKNGRRCCITQPPILLGDYCVPLDTIDAFRAVQAALIFREHKPIVLLCGPPVSGKTTIANSVREWLRQEHGCVFVFVNLQEDVLTSESVMWTELGECVDPDLACIDKESFVRACAELPTLWFLIVDNLQLMLA